MKRFVAVSAAVLMMCSSVMAGEINVKLNGEAVEFSSQEPVVIEGRTLIPLRGVFEKLGYEIEWDNKTKTAVFKKADTEVKVTVNADSFDVNGEKVSLDGPAQIVNGSMMLPLRAVGEATGLEVDWDSESKTVSLKSQTDDNNTVQSLEELENSITSDDVEFKFDKESGMATIKPKDIGDKSTDKTTDKTKTESSTENIRPFTAEEKDLAEKFVVYTETIFFCNSYLSAVGKYTSELNGYNPRKEEEKEKIITCLENVIKVNDVAMKRIKCIKNISVNSEYLGEINNCMNIANKLYNALLKNYKADKKNVYDNSVRAMVYNYNESMQKLQNAITDTGDLFNESLKNWMWDIDSLSVSEASEVKNYQEQVGKIIDKYLKNNESLRSKKDKSIERLAESAGLIRKEVSKINPPDICRVNAQILIQACELIEKGVSSKDITTDEEISVDIIYPAVLSMTFDVCTKACAGEYYNSYLLG